jgi:tight adherence protein C
VRLRLLAAGARSLPATRFLAGKAALGLGGLLLGLMVGAAAGADFAVLFAAACAFLGFRLPDFLLSTRARRRGDQIRAQLPDALDLLAVSVEAGLGFDAAVAKLTEHMRGPLLEELGLALGEMRIGKARHESLRSLAARVDVPELTAFVRAVIQGDQLGLSLGRSLKVQAEDARRRRQSAAEEKAMKAPVKMLFPTVLFIFPALFVVILAPALLNFAKVF